MQALYENENCISTIVSVYSPTLDSSDDVKDRLYDTLYSTLRIISQDDKIILLGDFYARVGRNHDIWHGVIGHHGVGNMNSSCLRLLSLCSELGLAITNTFFQLRDMHKTFWMHPRSKHWHLIDYVIVRRRDLNEVQITRDMRGEECSTDHRLIRSTLRLTVKPPARRQKPRNKLNVYAAHNQNIREELRNAIDQSLSHISTTTTLNCTSKLTMEWQALSSALLAASQSTHGNMDRRHQDWFDDNATDIRSLIHDIDAAHDALLRSPTFRTLRERFSSKRATVQRKLRWIENNWWAEKAAQIQSYANINDTKSFYETPKAVYGPRHFSLHPVRSIDGDLIKNKELILKRWAEYLQNLLNKVHTIHCRSSQNLMTHHPLTKWKGPFSDSKTTKQPVLTTSLLRSLSMVAVLYTEGCIISSLTAGPLNVSHSNGKMPTLFLYTSKWVTEQNVATVVAFPFSLLQAKC